MMCCDWLDLVVAISGGFFLGCVVMALLAKKIMEETMSQQGNVHARTALKNANLGEWK